MDFAQSETQQAVTDLSRKIFTSRVTPALLKAVEAEDDHFARSLWKDLADAGLLATALPESVGGSGQGLFELAALLQEAGAAVAPIPLYATLVLGALPIAHFGTPEQQSRILPGVGAGETVLTAALVEDGSRDVTSPLTTARRDSLGFRLTGQKDFVPAAHLASAVLVPAREAGEGGGVGVFFVDPKASGVRLERQVTTTGEPEWRMTLEGAPAGGMLGDFANGKDILRWMEQRAIVGLCAMEMGVTERVLRMTAEYTTNRHQFDRPIATFQAVAQRAADAYVDVAAIRLATLQAIFQLESGVDATLAVSLAKFWAAEAGHRVVYAGQHLHGGIGFDRDYPLFRYYLLSKHIELTLGSAAIHLARIGADLAKA